MGPSKNCLRQKCGDIFLNISTIKNKTKVFTFHCTMCSMDCDQLKKFSKHLESHMEFFERQLCNSVVHENNDTNRINPHFEVEHIKAEFASDELVNDIVADDYNAPICADPLETEKMYKTEMDLSGNIKTEEYLMEEIEECVQEATGIAKETNQNKIRKNSPLYNELSSEYSIQNTKDYNFIIERELKNVQNSQDSITTTKPKVLQNDKNATAEIKNVCSIKASKCNKLKRRSRIIIDSILPFLIQQYKKYEILWQIDDMSFGIKIKKYEIYSKIAEALKQEKHKIITLDDLNYQLNYLNELYSKDKEQELKCKMEGKTFIPEYEHYKEMTFLSKSQGPFLCSICNKILPRYHPYCQHMAQHNNTQPYKCPLCDSSFVSYYKYLVHKKRHLGILDFHCKICGKGYMFKSDLEWHVTSHSGDKPYLCQICGAGFRARHHYNSHVRKHEERFRHECHICKKGFNYLDILKSHVKSHLNIRDVVCKICGKGFVHMKYLRRHELIHGEEKHYKCNECGKAFFQPSGLRAHRKNHHS